MLDKMTNQLGFQGNALILRAERQPDADFAGSLGNAHQHNIHQSYN